MQQCDTFGSSLVFVGQPLKTTSFSLKTALIKNENFQKTSSPFDCSTGLSSNQNQRFLIRATPLAMYVESSV